MLFVYLLKLILLIAWKILFDELLSNTLSEMENLIYNFVASGIVIRKQWRYGKNIF